MQRFLVPVWLLFSIGVNAQCKTFKIGIKGDTLNCTDMKGLKQGPWVIHAAPLRGEPGYEEEGFFKNDRREGTWRRFNLMGDLLAIENYRWGNLNGKCQYFTLMGLEREESWKALNPSKTFDTIEVQDPVFLDKYEKVVIKVDGKSLRHGVWKYYDPSYGTIQKIENYVLDELQTSGSNTTSKTILPDGADSAKLKPAAPPAEKVKPKEVEEFEKKNKNKKKIAVRDGKTGG